MALVGHVESAVREYTLLLAGRTIPPEHSEPLGYGELLVTHVDDQTVAVKVHHQNGILLLVVVGPQDVAVEAVGRSELLKEKNVTTPVVLLHGRAHPFVGIAGKVVLGTLELGPAGVVLLTAWAGQFHFLLLPASGGEAKVIRSGSMRSMRAEYDITPWLAGATADSPPRRGFEEDVQRAHARMVQGAPEPSSPGRPTLTSVMRAALRYVKELCQTWRLPQRAAKRRRGAEEAAKQQLADRKRERALARGRQRARILLEVLLAGGLFGLGDLIGPTSEILATLMTIAPGLRLTPRGLADALRFLEEIAGFLVTRASPRTWWIHLRDLVNPESQIHKMLCKMTPGRFQLFDEPDPEGRILAAVAAKRAQMDRSSAAASAPSNSTRPAAASAPSPSPAPAATPSPPATVAAVSPPAPASSPAAVPSSAPAVLAATSISAPTVTSAPSSAAASPPPPVPPARLVVPPSTPPAASPASTSAVATSAPSSAAASPSPAPPAAVSPAASPVALAPGPAEATSAPSSAAASPSRAPPAAVSPAASPVALAPAAAFATRTSPGLLRPPLRTELLAYLDIEFPPTCMPAVQLVIEQARQHLRVLAEMLREGAIVPSESEVLDVVERVGRAVHRMVELELAASAPSVAAASLVEPTAPPEPRSPRGDHS